MATANPIDEVILADQPWAGPFKEKIAQLEKTIDDLKRKSQNQRETIAELNGIAEEVKARDAKIAELEEQLSAAKELLSEQVQAAAEIEKMRKELEAARFEAAEIEKTLHILENALGEKEREKTELRMALQSHKHPDPHDHSTLEDRIHMLEQELAESEQQREIEKREAKEKQDELEETIRTMEASLEKQATEFHSNLRQSDTLRLRIEDLEKRRDGPADLEDLIKERDQLRQSLGQLKALLQRAQEELLKRQNR
jgi:uncharacterized protein Smg (DUF494 family)